MRTITTLGKAAVAGALAIGLLAATATGAAAIEPLDNPIIPIIWG